MSVIVSSHIITKPKSRKSIKDKKSEEEEYRFQNDITENGTQVNLKTAKCFPIRLKMIETNAKPTRRKLKLMDWKKFHRMGVVYNFLEELEKDYPAICTVSVIGNSVQGRDIKMLKISNSDATNTGIWLDGSIHSREWISTAVVTYIADFLVKNFHELPSYITNKDWYLKDSDVYFATGGIAGGLILILFVLARLNNVFNRHIVPILNPDGYEYTHTKDRLWRKNRASHEGKRVGVDLNRNFSFGWGNNDDEGSSGDPTHVFYRGPQPFSEPEAASVRDTILGSCMPFKVFLSFHSYFEAIIFPWGYKGEPCPDYLNLLEGGICMARAIYETAGKVYKVGSTHDLTYPACGTSTDWSYGIAKIPYSYMIELRSKLFKFRLPREQILITCIENLNAVKSLMKFVDTKL